MAYTFDTDADAVTIIDYGDTRNVRELHLWTGADIVDDDGLYTKCLIITGIESVNAYATMGTIDTGVDNGDIITLFGAKNAEFNTSWLIESFQYEIVSPGIVQWTVTLEKYYTGA